MNPAIRSMLAKYDGRSLDDQINALREILQELVLCGLWRARFFEKAAFYGGTALRILFGLDRFSEDMDFSLLTPDKDFDLSPYCAAVERELRSWGFAVEVETKKKRTSESAIEAAFLKANARELLMAVDVGEQMAAEVHGRRLLRIKIEVDTDPPPGFSTETQFLLQPIPFSVRVYDAPSLFAGKMHAVLCRGWKNRVKGRDWYDFVWYVGRSTELDLAHLEARMRQSGHFSGDNQLDESRFRSMLKARIDSLDIDAARKDVERFLVDRSTISLWSKEFFLAVAEKIIVRD